MGLDLNLVDRMARALRLPESEADVLLAAAKYDICLRGVLPHLPEAHQRELVASTVDAALTNNKRSCRALARSVRLVAGIQKVVDRFNQEAEAEMD